MQAVAKLAAIEFHAMISLETIGYFSDEPRSQTYPALGLGVFLSESRELHRVCRRCSLTRLASADAGASFAGAEETSFGRRGVTFFHSRSGMVGSMVVLAERLSRHYDY